MFYTIYKVTNLANSKIYIGKHQTKNLDDGYMGSGKRLGQAKRKYGLENFIKEILFVFETEQEMNDKEKELVTEEFCLREDTYNLCQGGYGGWSYANKNGLNQPSSETTVQSKSNKNSKQMINLHSNKTKSLYRSSFLRKGNPGNKGFSGRNHSQETKLKIAKTNSLRQTGNLNSQHGTMWITNGIKSMKIKNNESIPEGWKKGRKLREVASVIEIS